MRTTSITLACVLVARHADAWGLRRGGVGTALTGTGVPGPHRDGMERVRRAARACTVVAFWSRTMRPTLALLLLLAACGGGDDDGAGTVDAGLAIDAPGCDVTAALPTNYRPIAMVSTGAASLTTTGGVTRGTINATAGGAAASADNPYIYIDLDNGVRVDITDVGSRTSTAWDIALKRASIKLNGGDSGPGGGGGARVAAATLAEVTAAPAAFACDDWATADCMLNATPSGEPATAMGDWYDYNDATHELTPKAEVWVIRLGEASGGGLRKLRLVTYYGDPAMPMRGGYYGVEWAPL